MMNKLLLTLFLLPLFLSTTAQDSLDWDVLIKDIRVVSGEQVLEQVDVAIRGGFIVGLATDISGTANTIIDGQGKTLVPPLINAHVHAWFPGHLQQAAQAGVLGLLDMHSSTYVMDWLKTYQDSVGYAYYWGAGSGATVPGGHGTQFGVPVPTIDSSLSARQYTLDRIAEGVNYIKILREPSRPTITFEQIDTVIQTAHEQGVKVVAHISRRDDAVKLAEMGIDGLVHIWIDEPLTDEQLAVFRKHQPFIIPTILTNLRLLEFMATQEEPFMEAMTRAQLIREIQRLQAAGVVLLAGTDPPNFNINYGSDLYTELALLVEGGMSPVEAILASSQRTAKAFQFPQAQLLKEGAPASFLVVDGNPVENIAELDNLEAVWDRGAVVFEKE